MCLPSLELPTRQEASLQEGETRQLPLHGKTWVPGDAEPPGNPELDDSEPEGAEPGQLVG